MDTYFVCSNSFCSCLEPHSSACLPFGMYTLSLDIFVIYLQRDISSYTSVRTNINPELDKYLFPDNNLRRGKC